MKQTINYNQLVKRNKQIDQLKKQGFIFIDKNKFALVGKVLIGLGIATCWIPLTTIPLIIAGLLLLGFSMKESLKLIEDIKFKIKQRFRK